MARKDLWSGLILAGLGLLVVFVLIPQGVVEPRKVKYAALSPSYYPRLIGIALILLGAVVALRDVFSPAGTEQDPARHPRALQRTAIFFGLLAVYGLAVSASGFILPSIIALAAALLLAGERRIWLISVISLVLPFGLYFFFLKIASIPIPAGLLAPLLEGI
ncbi:MAG: tripartite tricarboxylate transporter TctB family protein [Pseudomonadota bacterium]